MKKVYGHPQAVVEGFAPNEYVAACWGVACSTDAANQYEIDKGYYDGGNVSHATGGHCGDSTNQKITVNSDNKPVKMTEVGTDGLGNLACTIYADTSYEQKKDISTVQTGDYIYWTTTSGSRTWHHQGTVVGTYPGHPNRS